MCVLLFAIVIADVLFAHQHKNHSWVMDHVSICTFVASYTCRHSHCSMCELASSLICSLAPVSHSTNSIDLEQFYNPINGNALHASLDRFQQPRARDTFPKKGAWHRKNNKEEEEEEKVRIKSSVQLKSIHINSC